MASKDPEKKRGADRRYRENNRAKIREKKARSYAANCARERETARRYYADNAEKVRNRMRRYRAINPEKSRESERRWREANPEARRAITLRRRARCRVGAPGADSATLQARIAEIYTESCVWCSADDDICVDHIWPLSKGGRHAAYNLQALCRTCNSRKGGRLLPQLEECISDRR